MKSPRLVLALTLANVALLVACAAQFVRPATAQPESGVLRGRALEIVDDQGRVRASISVLPASKSSSGESYSETVLLRLITELGRPSVKIGASEQTAGLSLAGPTGTKSTYVILEAKGDVTSLVLRNEDGHQQIVRP